MKYQNTFEQHYYCLDQEPMNWTLCDCSLHICSNKAEVMSQPAEFDDTGCENAELYTLQA